MLLAGVGFGLLGALALRKVIASQLFGISPLDPATLAVGILLVILFPIFYNGWLSFHLRRLIIPQTPFVGMANYQRVLQDPEFWNAVWVTAVWAVGSIGLNFLVGLGMALVLDLPFPGRSIFRIIFLVPWATPQIVAAMNWKWLLNDQFGLVNALLLQAGVLSGAVAWLADLRLAQRIGEFPQEPADHFFEFRAHIFTQLGTHLFHHAAQGARVILQPFQVGRIGHALQAVLLRMGHTNPADFSGYIAAMAVRAGYFNSTVFRISQEYFKFPVTVQAAEIISGHTILDKGFG